MTLQEMYDEMAKLLDEIKKFVEEHEDENGNLSEEDTETYEKMDKKLVMLMKKANREEKLAKADNYLSEPITPTILNQPGSMGGGWNIPTTSDPFSKTHGGKNFMRHQTSNEYRREFVNAIRSGFKKVKAEYLNEGNLSSGGFLLPTEMHDEIISELTAANIFRQIGRTITTASEHKIPLVTTKPTAAWVAEGADISFSNETFGQISLGAHKLAVAVKVTNELLQDAFFAYDLESHLAKEFADEFARAEENAMLNGTGEGQPKGILPLLAESATGTLQTTGAEITADDLLQLQYSVDRMYRGKGVWLASDATLAAIRRLKDANQGYIWEPSMQESEPPRLFGRPVFTSNFLPPPSAGNVAVLFGDFADYFIIGERGQREFQPLRELFALSGQTAFLMIERIDSVFTNMAAIRGLKIRTT